MGMPIVLALLLPGLAGAQGEGILAVSGCSASPGFPSISRALSAAAHSPQPVHSSQLPAETLEISKFGQCSGLCRVPCCKLKIPGRSGVEAAHRRGGGQRGDLGNADKVSVLFHSLVYLDGIDTGE